MKHTLKFITILLLSLLINSCQKSTAGPKGDTGATGAQGPAGTPGTAGNANLQVQTFTTTSSSWTSYNWPYEYIETVLTVPAITSTVVLNGDVRVYVLESASSSWIAMPYSFLAYQYTYKYKAGQVIINYTMYNGNTPVNPGAQQFKVVVIPPALIKKYPNVNWNDLNEVNKFFNAIN